MSERRRRLKRQGDAWQDLVLGLKIIAGYFGRGPRRFPDDTAPAFFFGPPADGGAGDFG